MMREQASNQKYFEAAKKRVELLKRHWEKWSMRIDQEFVYM